MNEAWCLSDALAAMSRGQVSSSALVDQALEAASMDDEGLGVFVSRFPERAREAAAAADAARRSGRATGALLGLPIGVKDIIATADGPTTGQSLVHDPNWAHGDAEVVARLRSAGAVIVGKASTMEFALGVPDPSKPFPIPRNPWDTTRWAGGSSSGSASGVVTGMFLAALGTDTGASVRMPAALCGVTGLKPTFGRVPKSGVIPLGYSLDCVGPMARTARDCAVMLGVIAGQAASDPLSLDAAVPDYAAMLDRDLSGLRIGVDDLHRFVPRTEDPAVRVLLDEVVRALERAGATIVPLELPAYREVTAAAVVSIFAEALAYHAPDLRTRWEDYFASTRIALGMAALIGGADYVQAQRVRRVGRLAMRQVFEDVDVVLTPTVSRAAPPLDEAADYTGTLFAAEEYAYHTAYWNALGNPALSMPMGFNGEGLPLAAQLVGRPFEEATLLNLADAYQRATDFHLATPTPVLPPPPSEPREAPVPAVSTQDVDLVAAWLKASGLTVPASELPTLAAGLETIRVNVDLLHAVPGTRYADPGTNLAAEFPLGGAR